MTEFLYSSPSNEKYTSSSSRAVIVLPEIFGLNNFIKSTTNRFVDELHIPAFALDFFYAVDKDINVIPYTEHEKAVELMLKVNGEIFLEIFNKSVDLINKEFPNIKEFIVTGYCFGGKLAYISGINKKVNRIISFYGSRSVAQGFFKEESAVESLINERKNDKYLYIDAFYGDEDTSISKDDRDKINDLMKENNFNFEQTVYPHTGHAFCNFERKEMYNKMSADLAWEKIKTILK